MRRGLAVSTIFPLGRLLPAFTAASFHPPVKKDACNGADAFTLWAALQESREGTVCRPLEFYVRFGQGGEKIGALMNPRDLVMVFSSLASMAAGVFLPQLAAPLAAMPRLILIFMLYMSFLAVGVEELRQETRTMAVPLCLLTIYRLALLPILCLAVFRLIMPQFALGAFLLGASPVGVMAAVFSLMLRANTALILVANIATSLLLPLSLPPHLELGHMGLSLAVTILLPFAAAHLTRTYWNKLRRTLLQQQFPLLTVAIAVSNISIFSNYGDLLRQSPSFIFQALGAACLLCVLMTLAALPITRHMTRQTRLAFLISFGVINNVLLMIVCMEFFSATEALMAAAYLVPLYILLFYYRLCSREPAQT